MPGRYTTRMVQGDTHRHISSVLLGVLRHASFGDDRDEFIVMEPAEYQRLARAGPARQHAGAIRRAALPRTRLQRLPRGQQPIVRAPPLRGPLWQTRAVADAARSSWPTSGYIRDSILAAGKANRRGLHER